MTLHLVAGDDYPAFHQLARQTRMRKWRKDYAHLDEEKVVAELARWLREPRSNNEIRERVLRYEGVPTSTSGTPMCFARNLLPLVQLPPAGFWRERSRPQFVVDPRPLPEPADAATLVLARYLARVRAGEQARRRRLGGRGPARLRRRPGSGSTRSRTATRRAPSCSTCPTSRCRRRRRGCRCASCRAGTRRCWPTPTATGSSRPSWGR